MHSRIKAGGVRKRGKDETEGRLFPRKGEEGIFPK
jgi:hypothetical protein